MLPVNARSEFVSRLAGMFARNFSDGFVVEISRMFQLASPAFHHPALRPTRGSGLGAAADMLGDGSDVGSLVDEDGAVAQAAAVSAAAMDSDERRAARRDAPEWFVSRSKVM